MLEEARDLGLLGPGPVTAHLEHAAGFALAVGAGEAEGWEPSLAVDLGTGAGLPGLPLALAFPASRWVLVDAGRRRAAFLRAAVERLELTDRVEVREERAEEVGRSATLRGRVDRVVARSFGPPAVVAECAAPLLSTGGLAVISEPPTDDPARWPDAGLQVLGMVRGPRVEAGGAHFQVLRQVDPAGARFPRRTGIPAKRPLF